MEYLPATLFPNKPRETNVRQIYIHSFIFYTLCGSRSTFFLHNFSWHIYVNAWVISNRQYVYILYTIHPVYIKIWEPRILVNSTSYIISLWENRRIFLCCGVYNIRENSKRDMFCYYLYYCSCCYSYTSNNLNIGNIG